MNFALWCATSFLIVTPKSQGLSFLFSLLDPFFSRGSSLFKARSILFEWLEHTARGLKYRVLTGNVWCFKKGVSCGNWSPSRRSRTRRFDRTFVRFNRSQSAQNPWWKKLVSKETGAPLVREVKRKTLVLSIELNKFSTSKKSLSSPPFEFVRPSPIRRND